MRMRSKHSPRRLTTFRSPPPRPRCGKPIGLVARLAGEGLARPHDFVRRECERPPRNTQSYAARQIGAPAMNRIHPAYDLSLTTLQPGSYLPPMQRRAPSRCLESRLVFTSFGDGFTGVGCARF